MASSTAPPHASRSFRIALIVGAALVVAYGSMLRFDAITLQYGPVTRPGWLRALQATRGAASRLRPASVTWAAMPLFPHRDGPPTHYESDPYTYLQYAREMRSFYAAHRREPVFPFVTRMFLHALDDQDVAVSFASAFFSVLAIVATLLLGAEAFSVGIGVAAAAALAIETDVVTWGTGGWRDDAFTVAVVLSTWALLRYMRSPSIARGLTLGVVGAFACLVRITSLTFLVPGLAYALLTLRSTSVRSAKSAIAAAAVTTVLIAPFLINCWRTFGDPLYAINVHADVYLTREGQPASSGETARQFVAHEFRGHFWASVDTLALGLSSYPLENKWTGFDPWLPHVGVGLSYAAIVGLILWIGSPVGRLLLVALATSLVPYAMTWRLIADWRFTEHAYPFYLLAACSAIVAVARAVSPAKIRATMTAGVRWRRVAFWTTVLATLAAAVWAVVNVLPVLVVRENLVRGDRAIIAAGARDGTFFVSGWREPITVGNVTARTSTGTFATIRIPVPRVQDYDARLRMDPVLAPGTETDDSFVVQVFLNDTAIGTVDLLWDPQRVGAYPLRLPATAVRRGFNRLVLLPQSRLGGSAAVRFWLLTIWPAS